MKKPEFHEALRAFLATGAHVLAPGEHAQTPWVWVKSLGHKYYLHADSTREGIQGYVALVDEMGDNLCWCAVANERGRQNKAAFGPEKVIVPGFYLYRELGEYE